MSSRCRLYLITPPAFDPDAFARPLTDALEAGDVACVQLRLKDVDDDAIRRAANVLLPIAQAHDVAFIMNDRPDLAAELGCDGVHVGQQDAAYEEARRIVGADAIVGVTCHASRHLAMDAAEAGADYVAFGAFFESGTKQRVHNADPEVLTEWQTTTNVPCVAIGGITVENGRALVAAGADFLAVAGGVWSHAGGPAEAVRAFNAIFDAEAPEKDDPPIPR
ncbi:MAG: thiamine phosphate synthase [Alphaproteobacteria bacterium]|nr:thiamine phosphate synthase [Alphaproteobacteria bacterium]